MKKTIILPAAVLLFVSVFLSACNTPDHCDAYPKSSSSHSSFHKNKR